MIARINQSFTAAAVPNLIWSVGFSDVAQGFIDTHVHNSTIEGVVYAGVVSDSSSQAFNTIRVWQTIVNP